MDHEEAFISAFVVSEKRTRYSDFLPKPKRRGEILNRFNHFFDFVPELATQVARDSDLVTLLRKKGSPATVHMIGGRDGVDGQELPLEEAINEAISDGWGIVISCIPGRLALYMQEFPPGDTFILSRKP